ncbi:MAG: GLUG motif-containing protein [Phycisphaerales bacterium]
MMTQPRVRARSTACVLCFCLLMDALPAAEFAGGTGAPNDPYQIATADQLVSIGSDPNLLDKHFVLIADIDLDPNLPGGRVFTQAVIAPDVNDSGSFDGVPFTGTFDGGGYRILNLTIRNNAAHYLSLFGYAARDAVVKDLRIDDARVSGEAGMCLGALVGRNGGRILRCYATAHVLGHKSVGILVGLNNSEIIDCRAGGEVVGVIAVGGLVGGNYSGAVLNCCTTGDVWATMGDCLGGLAGRNDYDAVIAHSYAMGDVFVGTDANNLGGLVGGLVGGSINDCYASGSVSGGDHCSSLGGLVGNADGYISDCYSTGRVSAGESSADIGGLVGCRTGGEVTGCFWDVETSGLLRSAGGTGLTTAQMQETSVFLAAGWDWVDERANGTADLWSAPEEGGYPALTIHSDAFEPHELEGSGVPDDPYRIVTAEDLGAVNHYDLAACYRLDADVDCGGITWGKAPIPYFVGQLDGDGRVVTNLEIQGSTYLGLFGVLGRNAFVVNLGIRDANVTGRDALGLLAGRNKGSIRACRAAGSISGDSFIADSTTQGGSSIGGLTAQNDGSVSDSYAVGDLTAEFFTFDMGGLAGSNNGVISRCYAAARISYGGLFPANCAGGLVGVNRGDINDSYFLFGADGGGADNGLGSPRTEARMKQHATFAGWDFEAVWTICEGKDYPRLKWEAIDCNQL